MMATPSIGDVNSPSETISVVAQAGAWAVRVKIMPMLVSNTEKAPLVPRRAASIVRSGGSAVSIRSAARRWYATSPPITPQKCPPITFLAECCRGRSASTKAVGPRLGKTKGRPVAQRIPPSTPSNNPASAPTRRACRERDILLEDLLLEDLWQERVDFCFNHWSVPHDSFLMMPWAEPGRLRKADLWRISFKRKDPISHL